MNDVQFQMQTEYSDSAVTEVQIAEQLEQLFRSQTAIAERFLRQQIEKMIPDEVFTIKREDFDYHEKTFGKLYAKEATYFLTKEFLCELYENYKQNPYIEEETFENGSFVKTSVKAQNFEDYVNRTLWNQLYYYDIFPDYITADIIVSRIEDVAAEISPLLYRAVSDYMEDAIGGLHYRNGEKRSLTPELEKYIEARDTCWYDVIEALRDDSKMCSVDYDVNELYGMNLREFEAEQQAKEANANKKLKKEGGERE